MSAAFEAVKASVDIVDADQRYGIQVVRGGKAHCPWHADRTPSLSFYRDNSRFHCFSCGAGGDVIDLVGMLLNLPAVDAVRELNSAYHLSLDLDKPECPEMVRKAIRQRRLRQKEQEIFRQWERGSFLILSGYLHTLRDWKRHYAPASPDQPLYPRFVEALNQLDYMEHLLNEVYVSGTKEEKATFFRSHEGMIRGIEQRLRREGIPYAGGNGTDAGPVGETWPVLLPGDKGPVAAA